MIPFRLGERRGAAGNGGPLATDGFFSRRVAVLMGSQRLKTVIIAILGAAALVAVVVWAANQYFESAETKPVIAVIDKYMTGYQKADLVAVKSTISGEMAESLPGSQTAFAKLVKDSANGQVKSWNVTKIDRNEYVDQSMVDVTVVSSKRTYELVFDIFHFTEGLRIRSVSEADQPDAAGSQNASATGGQGMGMGMGMGGMPTTPGHQ